MSPACPPASSSARRHEDVAFLRLDYGDIGVRASIQVSWLSPVKVRRITAVGSQRMAVYDDLAEDERIRIYDKSAVPAARTSGEQRMTYHTGDTVMPYVEFAEPLAVQDQEFVSCIRTGRTPTPTEQRPVGRPGAGRRADVDARAAAGVDCGAQPRAGRRNAAPDRRRPAAAICLTGPRGHAGPAHCA